MQDGSPIKFRGQRCSGVTRDLHFHRSPAVDAANAGHSATGMPWQALSYPAGRLSTFSLSCMHAGIIGSNGAGKSTLFRMLMGQEQPDSGKVTLGETVVPMYVDQSRGSLGDGSR